MKSAVVVPAAVLCSHLSYDLAQHITYYCPPLLLKLTQPRVLIVVSVLRDVSLVQERWSMGQLFLILICAVGARYVYLRAQTTQ